MTLVLAHAGHWIANLLYVAPVAIIVGALWWQNRRDKRSDKQARDR
jgi:hypothetical protein